MYVELNALWVSLIGVVKKSTSHPHTVPERRYRTTVSTFCCSLRRYDTNTKLNIKQNKKEILFFCSRVLRPPARPQQRGKIYIKSNNNIVHLCSNYLFVEFCKISSYKQKKPKNQKTKKNRSGFKKFITTLITVINLYRHRL